jgi:outer membrane protein assembly factor BamB
VYVFGTKPDGPPTSPGHRLYAFDAATGAPAWTADLPPLVNGSPVVVGGRVYVNAHDSVKVYDAASGNSLLSASVAAPDYAGSGSPAVAYGKIFVGTGGGKMVALDAASGAQVWSADLPFSDSSIQSSPAVANKVVYAHGSTISNDFNEVVAGFDVDTGVNVFAAVTSDNFVTSFPGDEYRSVAIANGRVFLGTENGRVRAFKLP